MPSWHFSKPRIPARAVVLSIAALAVPFAASQWALEEFASLLVWLVALIPAFLLAYYRGWAGAATSLAAAMATIALSNIVLIYRGIAVNELVLLILITVFIATSLGIGWLSEALHRARARAELIALTDELTQLPNRRHVRMFLERQLAGIRRTNIAVVLFDLDNFKRFNDEYGHPMGDGMLTAFADVMSAVIPAGGMPARYGGEEFLAVLVDCDEAAALRYANRVRHALSNSQPIPKPVTVSAGIAVGSVGVARTNELIVAADRALYRAKQGGRDRACCASEEIAAAS